MIWEDSEIECKDGRFDETESDEICHLLNEEHLRRLMIAAKPGLSRTDLENKDNLLAAQCA